MVEYASFLLNRFEVSADGKTAYERNKGKRAKVMGLEFGELLLWKRKPSGGALGKLTCMWSEGVYLGVKGSSGEIIVGDCSGVWKCRTVQRKPEEERWPSRAADLVVGVPWRKSDDDPNVDGEAPEVVRMEGGQVVPGYRRVAMEDSVPKRVMIRQQDLENFGYSRNCPGCSAILKGAARQGHSEACRKRIESEMKDDERLKRANKRRDEFIDRAVEKEEEINTEKKRWAFGHEKQPSSAAAAATAVSTEGLNDTGSAAGAASNGSSNSSTEAAQPVSRHGKRDREGEEDDHGLGSHMEVEPARNLKRCLEEKESEQHEQRRLKAMVNGFEVNEEEFEWPTLGVGSFDVNEEEASATETGESTFREEDDEWSEHYVDEKTGEPLPQDLVKAAVDGEVQFMHKIKLYDYAAIEECYERTGKAPTSAKWVRTNKGTAIEPDVRCRLVARDFNPKGEKDRADLFASMPPLEAKKFLFRQAVRKRKVWRRGRWESLKLRFIDVRKAHLNGVVGDGEYVYVELPREDYQPGKCARLLRWLYGMRPAASAWERDFTEKLESIGFRRGMGFPTVFYNAETSVRCVVHGDDFTFLGAEPDLDEVTAHMSVWYDLKVRGTLGVSQERCSRSAFLTGSCRGLMGR